MSAELDSDSQMEIAHVLCSDIVGYSKLPIDRQSEFLRQLNQIVRGTEEFRAAEAAGKLIRLPTGDGMALAFFTSPDAPVRCAIEIARALQQHRQLNLRMGIDSGPVNRVADVNDRSNVAGTGINMAQRVMDCGDAGHILLSKRVAGDLAQYTKWQPQLHDLGEVEVKHGVKVEVVNLSDGEVGNSAVPEKIRRLRHIERLAVRRRTVAWASGAIVLALTLAATFWFQTRQPKSDQPAGVDKSIAVLPFANLSADPENAFFVDGIQDNILTNLSMVADLKVISRTSVMQFRGSNRNTREIGDALHVSYLLEGSVQKANGRLRLNAQLINTRTDGHVWAQQYDRELSDVFAIQSELAHKIAAQLQANVSRGEKIAMESAPTQDMEAFDSYSRAKELVEMGDAEAPENLARAVKLLEKAVARDPKFARAYCLLTQTNIDFFFFVDHAPASRQRAELALQTAKTLAPESGETAYAEARFLYYGNRDYNGALLALEKAARSLPNSAEVARLRAWLERRLGHWAETMRNFARAIELDPHDPKSREGVVSTYMRFRHYDEANRVADRAIAELPEAADTFRLQKARAALQVGDTQRARAELEAMTPGDFEALAFKFEVAFSERNYAEAYALRAERARLLHDENSVSPEAFGEGLIARAEGNIEKARAAFNQAREFYQGKLRNHPDDFDALSFLAMIDAALDRKDDAIREADRVVELAPLSADLLGGPEVLYNVTIAYAWVGETDRAIEQLSALVKLPGGPDYGSLKLDPPLDSLRGDPRYPQLLVEAARPLPIE